MLALTENASTIVKAITDQSEDEVNGLRITSDEAQGLAISTAAEPAPGDETVETDGAVVYLDETASVQLQDQVLDGSVDEEGRVAFALAPQA